MPYQSGPTPKTNDRRVLPTSSSPLLPFTPFAGLGQPGTAPFAPMARTVPQGRAKRLRISWFSLGLLAGMGAMYAVMHAQQTGEMPKNMATAKPATETAAAAAASEKANDAAENAVLAAATPLPTPQAKPTPPNEPMPEIAYPLNLEFPITRGDTLTDVITQNHVPQEEAQAIVEAVKKVYNPRALTVGRTISLELDKEDEADEPFVRVMHVEATGLDTIVVKHTDKGYVAQKLSAPVHKAIAHAGGRIRGSLYVSASRAGLPDSMVAQVIKAYSYDVDFQRDVQVGDRFDALYESVQTADGKVVKTGKLLYAALTLSGKVRELYAYTDAGGQTAFYTAQGESTRKALLKTPINGAQISSGFGMRFHPILGFNKMHKGLDFAAVTGTPIYAAGEGVIRQAGPFMGYGNYVRIQHNASYGTAYGHMSRFAKGIKPGVKVKQGQIIGYVGTTGRSTGPHLHYEVLVMNQQVNPAKVTFKTGNQLGGRDIANFKRFRDNLKSTLAQAQKKENGKQLAMNQ